MLAVNKVSLLYTEKGLGHSASLMFYPFYKDLEVGSRSMYTRGLKKIYTREWGTTILGWKGWSTLFWSIFYAKSNIKWDYILSAKLAFFSKMEQRNVLWRILVGAHPLHALILSVSFF